MVAVSTDLTERLKLEERQNDLRRVRTILRARDQELRALVEGVRDYAIFTIDPAGLIFSWHRGAEIMKGYTNVEAVGILPERLQGGHTSSRATSIFAITH